MQLLSLCGERQGDGGQLAQHSQQGRGHRMFSSDRACGMRSHPQSVKLVKVTALLLRWRTGAWPDRYARQRGGTRPRSLCPAPGTATPGSAAEHPSRAAPASDRFCGCSGPAPAGPGLPTITTCPLYFLIHLWQLFITTSYSVLVHKFLDTGAGIC